MFLLDFHLSARPNVISIKAIDVNQLLLLSKKEKLTGKMLKQFIGLAKIEDILKKIHIVL